MSGPPAYSKRATASVQRALSTVRHSFAERRHTALLVVIIAVFTVRPLINDDATAHAVFSLALLALLLVALYTIQIDELTGERDALLAERRRLSTVGWLLFVMALVERMATIVAPSAALYQVGSMTWLIFAAFITWAELRAVLRQKIVTRETISMAISAYLLLSLTFGFAYIVLHQLQPHAFNFPSPLGSKEVASSDPQSSIFPVLIYFSLTTLTTIGYGDITPLSLQARYIAIAEGVTGQFYLAILVARLVAMQLGGSTARGTGKNPEEP